MCIENESTGKYTCSHAPYTRFTSVIKSIQSNQVKKSKTNVRYVSHTRTK